MTERQAEQGEAAAASRQRGGDDELLVRIRLIDQRYSTARTGFKALFGVALVWGAVEIARALSGLDTSATFLIDVLVDVSGGPTVVVVLGVAAVAGVWAFGERKLRHRKVVQMHERNRALEQRLDPRRTSSGLAATGETNPIDR